MCYKVKKVWVVKKKKIKSTKSQDLKNWINCEKSQQN